MEAHELPNAEKLKSEPKTRAEMRKGYFTKLQGILLILGTLVISLVAGYFICDKFVWAKQDQNRIEQRITYYENQAKKHPNDSNTRVNLGYSYYLNGQDDDAVKQLLIAIDLDKKNVAAYFNLGLIYNDEKRYDDALKMANKATFLAPRDFKGQLLEGMVYRKLKMYKDSLSSLQEANKLMPANSDIIFEMGKLAEDQGKLQDAEKLYKKALSYDPLYKPATKALKTLAAKEKGNN